MRLKSWESPRSEGRNSKGKGGSARSRQLKKQQQALRKKLKAQNPQSGDRQNYTQNQKTKGKETHISFPFVIFASAHSDYKTSWDVWKLSRFSAERKQDSRDFSRRGYREDFF